MNPTEAAELLAHCSAFDNRKPSAAAAIAWSSALHDVPLDSDARAAVAAYYTTPPKNPDDKLWILPHHVRTLRSQIRSKRLENFQYEPVEGETAREFIARYQGQIQAVASGRVTSMGRPALEGGPSQQFMDELAARGFTQIGRAVPDDGDATVTEISSVRRSGPLGVICPTCQAAALQDPVAGRLREAAAGQAAEAAAQHPPPRGLGGGGVDAAAAGRRRAATPRCRRPGPGPHGSRRRDRRRGDRGRRGGVVSEPEITPEDTAAMRKVPGDFRAYLRSEMDRGRARQKPGLKPQAPAPPGRQAGAWPPGTRPPDPPEPIPETEITRALAEYRDWLAAGQPKIHTRCECEPCRTLEGGTR
jgi:hypothetical protein